MRTPLRGCQVSVIASLLVLTACGREGGDGWRGLKPESPLVDGRTVADLIQGDDSVLLVVFRPEDCFVCSSTLYEAVQRRQVDSTRMRFLLTEAPSLEQQRMLARFRIRWDGALKGWGERNHESQPGPWVITVINGRTMLPRRSLGRLNTGSGGPVTRSDTTG